MQYVEIQETKLPVLGLGTWHMGMDSSKCSQEIGAVRYAIEKGMTHIDTAEMYSDGESERVVGEAIKDSKREELFITTKVSPRHFQFDQVLEACEGSLQRLGLEYVDLYLLHWPNYDVPLEETMRAMNKLVDAGKIKRIGVSNFDIELMGEARSLTSHGVFTNQVEYSLADLSPENDGVLEYCQENDMVLAAYSPLGQGVLTEKGKYPELDEICEKYEKTPVQVALNYLICQPNTIAIPKSSKKEHIDEILKASGWKLEEEDITKLRGSSSAK